MPELYVLMAELCVLIPELCVLMPELDVLIPEFCVLIPELCVLIPELHVLIPELHVLIPVLHVLIPELCVLISVTKHCRLSKKEKELQKEGSDKVAKWQMKANEWKEWLGSKETELDNQGSVGTEPVVVKQQKVDLEVNVK